MFTTLCVDGTSVGTLLCVIVLPQSHRWPEAPTHKPASAIDLIAPVTVRVYLLMSHSTTVVFSLPRSTPCRDLGSSKLNSVPLPGLYSKNYAAKNTDSTTREPGPHNDCSLKRFPGSGPVGDVLKCGGISFNGGFPFNEIRAGLTVDWVPPTAAKARGDNEVDPT
jgi:hypothetical protein